MKKEEIINSLNKTYQELAEYILSLNEQEFLFTPSPDKWTSGQQAAHVWKTFKPLNTVLSLPNFLLTLYIGKANRPSRTYEKLVERYETKLGNGGIADNPFSPKSIPHEMQQKLANNIISACQRLTRKLSRYSEDDLDHLILPHPLLGKITLREMMYFFIYHAKHHKKSIIENLKLKD